MQEWIAKNHPVEAAELRFEANPEGLTNDAQCVIDGTLNPNDVSDAVLQNLFEYSSKYTKALISQQQSVNDERIASGNATFTDRLQLEQNGDPRFEELKATQDAARAQAKRDRETINAAMAMQSKEAARQELLSMNGGVG